MLHFTFWNHSNPYIAFADTEEEKKKVLKKWSYNYLIFKDGTSFKDGYYLVERIKYHSHNNRTYKQHKEAIKGLIEYYEQCIKVNNPSEERILQWQYSLEYYAKRYGLLKELKKEGIFKNITLK